MDMKQVVEVVRSANDPSKRWLLVEVPPDISEERLKRLPGMIDGIINTPYPILLIGSPSDDVDDSRKLQIAIVNLMEQMSRPDARVERN